MSGSPNINKNFQNASVIKRSVHWLGERENLGFWLGPRSFKPHPLLASNYTHQNIPIQRFYDGWCLAKMWSELDGKYSNYTFSKFDILLISLLTELVPPKPKL